MAVPASPVPINELLSDVFLILELFFAPVIIYLALFKSRQMKRYRFYILNCAVWNAISNILLWFMALRFHFPVNCISMNAPFAVGKDGAMRLVFLLVLFMCSTELSVVYCLLHRFAYSLNCWLQAIFQTSARAWFFTAVPGLVSCAPILIALYVVEMSPEQAVMVDEIGGPNGAFCIPGPFFRQASIYLGVVMAGVNVMCISLYVFLFRTVVMGQSTLSSRTQRMQIMLVKAVGVQTFIGCVFMFVPASIMWFAVGMGWKSSAHITAAAGSMFAMHGPADALTMLYSITPYRRAVLSWARPRRAHSRAQTTRLGQPFPIVLTNSMGTGGLSTTKADP